MASGGNISSAVRQQRSEPPDALDDFPTPPWAVRAAIEIVREIEARDGRGISFISVREPCANRGCMVRPLAEAFGKVHASDVHDYGAGYPVLDYLFPGPMIPAQWTFMNPPFKKASEFILKSFEAPGWRGTAALVRNAFLEGQERYAELFEQHPPSLIAQHVERVILHKGTLRDPDEFYWDDVAKVWKKPSTATAYVWMFWVRNLPPQPFAWIKPCRKRLTRLGDYDVASGDDARRRGEPPGGLVDLMVLP